MSTFHQRPLGYIRHLRPVVCKIQVLIYGRPGVSAVFSLGTAMGRNIECIGVFALSFPVFTSLIFVHLVAIPMMRKNIPAEKRTVPIFSILISRGIGFLKRLR
jgi:hypothetical protein